MAVSAAKTWVAGEILTASDLNSEFSRVYTSGEDLGWPATKAKDLNGFAIQFSPDQLTTAAASSNGILDFTIANVKIFRMDGSAGTMVNGFDFTGQVTGTAPAITVVGDTNTNLNIIPKGTGVMTVDGVHVASYYEVESYL